jgi:hypothetical protein
VKSILFVLLAHFHSGSTAPVAAFENIEQCRQTQATASSNQAADYSCDAVPIAGEWTRKNARYVLPGSN